MDVLVLSFLQADSNIFQNETYCSRTDTHNNTLVCFQLWTLGWSPTPRIILREGSIAKSMNYFLSELMFVIIYVNHSSPKDWVHGVVYMVSVVYVLHHSF